MKTIKFVNPLIGQVFGRLTITSFHKRKNYFDFFLCSCNCGGTKICRKDWLTSGDTKSCGCLTNKTHGMSYSSEYSIWQKMHQRCKNQRAPNYPNYGGRGISICKRWNKFTNFYADMGDRPQKTTLDRIDNTGNYTPNNCRWATSQQQQNNRRNNRYITFEGKTLTQAQWATLLNITPSKISGRLRMGWPLEKIFERSK